MRAIRVSEFGGPSVLKLCTDLPVPSPHQKQELCVFLKQVTGLEKSVGDATFKFEPFVLHVQCKELGDAQLLVNATLN